MTRPVDVDDVEVILRGDLPASLADYARNKMTMLGGQPIGQIQYARIELIHQGDVAPPLPVRGQAHLNVDGRLTRAQVSAATGQEAVDLLVDRLGHRLLWLRQQWQPPRSQEPKAEPHEWRHGSEPTHRPPYYPRPAEERQIIRHKSFSPPRVRVEEAAWEMDQLDYDFHLFTEAANGSDAVIYRAGPTGYRLARLAAGPDWLDISTLPITLSPHPAPQLTIAEARERLDAAGLPFVFFANASTGRGCVLYHRYDGHYGLITPAE